MVSNRRDCGALDIARARGVAAVSLPVKEYGGDAAARDRAILDALRAARVELLVCAGYDRVLSDEVLAAYPDAILNIHPSLLPAFGGGMDAVEQALAAGVKVTGCTVHLLDAGAVDAGPIVLQAAVPVAGRRRRRHPARPHPRAGVARCSPRRSRSGRPGGSRSTARRCASSPQPRQREGVR